MALTLTDPKQDGRGDLHRNVTNRAWSRAPRTPRQSGTGEPQDPAAGAPAGSEGWRRGGAGLPSLPWKIEMTVPNRTSLFYNETSHERRTLLTLIPNDTDIHIRSRVIRLKAAMSQGCALTDIQTIRVVQHHLLYP